MIPLLDLNTVSKNVFLLVLLKYNVYKLTLDILLLIYNINKKL